MDAMQISEVESAVFTDISSDSLEYSTVTSQGAFSEYHEACIDEDILMLGGTLEKMNLNNSKMELNAFPENVSAKRTLMRDTQEEDVPKTPPKYASKRKAQDMELADGLRCRPKAVPKRLKAMEEGHTPITTKDAQHLVANVLLHRMKRGVLHTGYIRSISMSDQPVAGTMKMSEKSLNKMRRSLQF
ncbi:uncharacterized protein LOC116343728 [Contarinia nasturtii]|uniref:uncharacterized protein LOC116343728 n=1 Tax=Contarinia nasturtii TaxID=265458 RepID=UPI0012D462E6|nr:uncharacterized protein LOC116343728 [Contarinia nasturtii]